MVTGDCLIIRIRLYTVRIYTVHIYIYIYTVQRKVYSENCNHKSRGLVTGLLKMMQKGTIYLNTVLVLSILSKLIMKSHLSIKFILLSYTTRECFEMFKISDITSTNLVGKMTYFSCMSFPLNMFII